MVNSLDQPGWRKTRQKWLKNPYFLVRLEKLLFFLNIFPYGRIGFGGFAGKQEPLKCLSKNCEGICRTIFFNGT